MVKRVFSLLLIIFGLIGPTLAIAGETSLTRVLFVGNSYLYYNDSLHNHVKRMASERFSRMASRDFQYKSATIGGARLQHHDIEWLLTPGKIGVDRPFQAVIMQGGSFEPLTADTKGLRRHGDTLRGKSASYRWNPFSLHDPCLCNAPSTRRTGNDRSRKRYLQACGSGGRG